MLLDTELRLIYLLVGHLLHTNWQHLLERAESLHIDLPLVFLEVARLPDTSTVDNEGILALLGPEPFIEVEIECQHTPNSTSVSDPLNQSNICQVDGNDMSVEETPPRRYRRRVRLLGSSVGDNLHSGLNLRFSAPAVLRQWRANEGWREIVEAADNERLVEEALEESLANERAALPPPAAPPLPQEPQATPLLTTKNFPELPGQLGGEAVDILSSRLVHPGVVPVDEVGDFNRGAAPLVPRSRRPSLSQSTWFPPPSHPPSYRSWTLHDFVEQGKQINFRFSLLQLLDLFFWCLLLVCYISDLALQVLCGQLKSFESAKP